MTIPSGHSIGDSDDEEEEEEAILSLHTNSINKIKDQSFKRMKDELSLAASELQTFELHKQEDLVQSQLLIINSLKRQIKEKKHSSTTSPRPSKPFPTRSNNRKEIK